MSRIGQHIQNSANETAKIDAATDEIGDAGVQTIKDLDGSEAPAYKGAMAIKDLNVLIEMLSGFIGGRYKALGGLARLATG